MKIAQLLLDNGATEREVHDKVVLLLDQKPRINGQAGKYGQSLDISLVFY